MMRIFHFFHDRGGPRRFWMAAGIVLLAAAGAGTAWWWFSRPVEVIRVRRRKPPKVTLEKAMQLYETGHYEEALDFCIKNRRFYRDDPAFWNFYGMSLRTMAYVDSNLTDRDEEIAAFEKALELDPGFTAARMNYANTLWEIGRREEAAAQYREVLRENPDHPDFRAILERMENDRRRSALREEEMRRKAAASPAPPQTGEASSAEPQSPMPAPAGADAETMAPPHASQPQKPAPAGADAKAMAPAPLQTTP